VRFLRPIYEVEPIMNKIRLLTLCIASLGCWLSAAFSDPQHQDAKGATGVAGFPAIVLSGPGDVLRRQGGSIGTENESRRLADARSALEKAKDECETGNITSCQTAGVYYKDGTGTSPDPRQARVYFEKSCGGSNFQGCNDLAFLLARGDGGPVEMIRAKSLLDRACTGNLQMSCFNLAFLLVPSDSARAMTLYRQACERGWFGACYNLGGIYSDGQYVVRDPSLARFYYRRTCDGGIMRGCDALQVQDGNARLEAQNGAKPTEEIVADLERDCANNKPRACNDLGMRHFEADGVTRDWFRSADLFKRACDEDSMTACFNLGSLYAQGQGVQRDLAAAAALFLRACDGGNSLSCQTLAEQYLNGDGVGTSPQKAADLFERLCNQRRVASCISLGDFHESHAAGKGAAEALKWFQAALVIDETNPQARLGINRLRPGLDASQRCIPRAYPQRHRPSVNSVGPSPLKRNDQTQKGSSATPSSQQDRPSLPDRSLPAALVCGN
jgi:uncharacterized protein